MTDDMKQNVNTSSAAARQNPTEDRKNWKADNELGQGLKAGENREPLFMKDSPEGSKRNAQDEKDETEE